jgi:hypothetical protein
MSTNGKLYYLTCCPVRPQTILDENGNTEPYQCHKCQLHWQARNGIIYWSDDNVKWRQYYVVEG